MPELPLPSTDTANGMGKVSRGEIKNLVKVTPIVQIEPTRASLGGGREKEGASTGDAEGSESSKRTDALREAAVVEGGGIAEEVENGATRLGSTLGQEAGDEASDGQQDEQDIGTEEGAASGGKRKEILSHATVTPEDDHPPPSIGDDTGGVVQQTAGGAGSMPEEVGEDAGLESESVVEAKVEVEELGSDGRAQSGRMAKEGKPNEEGALTNRSSGTHADDGITSISTADEASREAGNEVAVPYHVFHCELPGKCGFRGSLEEVAEHQKEHCPNRERPLVNRDKWSCVALDLSINRLRSLDSLVNHEGPPTGLTLPMSGSILALVSKGPRRHAFI